MFLDHKETAPETSYNKMAIKISHTNKKGQDF